MSNFLYGMHEPGGQHIFWEEAVGGWIVFTEELGHDPGHHGGKDYGLEAKGLTPIVRLNNGYGDVGTVPAPQFYRDFAQRVANHVNLSYGCTRWIIGNEPNHPVEWPAGVPIQADSYAICYVLCRNAIRSLFGHKDDEVLPAGIAPWCAEIEGWLEYYTRMLDSIEERGGGYDGIVLHTYTHGSDPQLITDESTMDPPYAGLYYNFRAYRDFLRILPTADKNLPVYITETDQNQTWADTNSGWVKEAYAEINRWNKLDKPTIHCLCLYRWPPYDQYVIEGNQGVIADFREAMAHKYTWKEKDMSEEWYTIATEEFEGPFVPNLNEKGQIDGHLTAQQGWTPVWKHDETPGILDRPEWKPAGADQVLLGSGAQAIHGAFTTLDGAIAKVFTVVAGSKCQVSVRCMGETDIEDSDQPMMGMVIEVASGLTISYAHRVVIAESEWWSQDPPNAWDQEYHAISTPEFVAPSDSIVVYLRHTARNARRSHSHFDHLLVTSTNEGSVEPPPSDLAAQIRAIATGMEQYATDLRLIASKMTVSNPGAKAKIEAAQAELDAAMLLLGG